MGALTAQIVVRVDDELLQALAADAADNGRTVAQSVRFILRKSLAQPPSLPTEEQP